MRLRRETDPIRASLLHVPLALLVLLFGGVLFFAMAQRMSDGLHQSQHERYLREHGMEDVVVTPEGGAACGLARRFHGVQFRKGVSGMVCCGPEVARLTALECYVVLDSQADALEAFDGG